MPYRRLPNTDQARVRALKAAVEKGDLYSVRDLAISLKTLFEARNFLQRFEAAQIYYTQCYDNQAKASRKHQANVKTARLYISHFIQVLNLAVLRDEIKTSHKNMYGLPEANVVPDLLSEAALVEWGKKIIEGEQQRTAQGGIPIYNPTIARVKVHYDIFLDSYERQKNLQALTNRSLEELASMRGRADELILDIWNQVETKYQDVTPNEVRLDKCRDYGLIYYYRSSEKVKEENEKLIAGINASATIKIASAKNALVVPLEALAELEDGTTAVYTVTDAGTVHIVPVTTGLETDLQVEIKSDEIKEGQKIILNPGAAMTEGMAVAEQQG